MTQRNGRNWADEVPLRGKMLPGVWVETKPLAWTLWALRPDTDQPAGWEVFEAAFYPHPRCQGSPPPKHH